jgi:hypothetical protein
MNKKKLFSSLNIVILISAVGIIGCQSQKVNQKEECIDPSKINEEAICTMEYAPVCGCNDITYGNACQAENAGLLSWTEGECEL